MSEQTGTPAPNSGCFEALRYTKPSGQHPTLEILLDKAFQKIQKTPTANHPQTAICPPPASTRLGRSLSFVIQGLARNPWSDLSSRRWWRASGVFFLMLFVPLSSFGWWGITRFGSHIYLLMGTTPSQLAHSCVLELVGRVRSSWVHGHLTASSSFLCCSWFGLVGVVSSFQSLLQILHPMGSLGKRAYTQRSF